MIVSGDDDNAAAVVAGLAIATMAGVALADAGVEVELLWARERLRTLLLNPPSAGEIWGVDAREDAWLDRAVVYPEAVDCDWYCEGFRYDNGMLSVAPD